MSTSRDSYRIHRVSMTANSCAKFPRNKYCIPAGDMQIKSFASCWSFILFGASKGNLHSDLTISRLSRICAQYLQCKYIARCQAKAPWHNARTVRQSLVAHEESGLTDASQGTEHQAQKCRRKPHYYILERVAPGGLVVQEPGLPSAVLEKIQNPTR